MGLFDLFKSKKMEISVPKVIDIYSPIDGKVIPLSDIPDESYAQKMVGDGCGIEPTGNIIYSPTDGDISIEGANHSFFIKNSELEVFFHFGIAKSFSLQQAFFDESTIEKINFIKKNGLIRLKDDGCCEKGEKIIKVNYDSIKECFYSFKSPFIISDMDRVASLKIVAKGEVKAGDLLMRVILK